MTWRTALHAAHSLTIAAAGFNALLQRGNVGIFTGAGHQSTAETPLPICSGVSLVVLAMN